MKNNRIDEIRMMMLGNRSEIVRGLNSENKCLRLDGLLWAAYHEINDEKVIERIRELKSDEESAMGFKVCDYAIAALDVLGIERYQGNDDRLSDLIMNFLPSKSDVEKAIKNTSNGSQSESA